MCSVTAPKARPWRVCSVESVREKNSLNFPKDSPPSVSNARSLTASRQLAFLFEPSARRTRSRNRLALPGAAAGRCDSCECHPHPRKHVSGLSCLALSVNSTRKDTTKVASSPGRKRVTPIVPSNDRPLSCQLRRPTAVAWARSPRVDHPPELGRGCTSVSAYL